MDQHDGVGGVSRRDDCSEIATKKRGLASEGEGFATERRERELGSVETHRPITVA
jgi:hypothetical protein